MSEVLDVNAGEWETEILKSDTLVLVDFWHQRCPWCLRLAPVFDEVAKNYKGRVKFAKIDVLKSQENQNIAVKYGIMGTPTLVFFCEGKPIETFAGFQPKERLQQLIDDMIDKHRECVDRTTEFKTS